MIKWTVEKVKYRLCWWNFFENYMMGIDTEPIPKVHKRIRRSTDPLFVTQALDNAFFKESLEILSEQEWRFLEELYIDNGIDESLVDVWKQVEIEPGVWVKVKVEDEIIIKVPMDAWEAVARRAGIDPFDMQKIADGAIKRMVSYLNEHE